MTVKILIPTPLRPFVDGQEEVEFAEADTVNAIFEQLVSGNDQLRKNLYDGNGKLRKFINIYVNDNDIRDLKNEATSLASGDVVSIVPAIAGGVFNVSI